MELGEETYLSIFMHQFSVKAWTLLSLSLETMSWSAGKASITLETSTWAKIDFFLNGGRGGLTAAVCKYDLFFFSLAPLWICLLMLLNVWILLWNSPIKSTGKTPLVQLCLQVSKPVLMLAYGEAQRELRDGGEQVWAAWIRRDQHSAPLLIRVQSSRFDHSQSRTSSRAEPWNAENQALQ